MWQFCIALLLMINSIDARKAPKTQRLEKRIRILEDKVHLELSDLHEDLEAVVKLVNETLTNTNTNGQSFGKYDGNISEKNLAKLVSQLTELKDVITDKTKAVWIGFSKEKSTLRRHAREVDEKVQCLNRSISTGMKSLEDSLNTRLEAGILSLEKNVDKVNDRLRRLEETTQLIHDMLNDLKMFSRDTKNSIRNHQQKLSTVPNAIENLTNKQSSLEDIIVNIKARTSIMLKFGLTHWGVSRFGSSYYFVLEDKTYWADAKRKCESVGGYLVEIDSVGELQHVKSMITTDARKGEMFWLGGNDVEVDGTWRWAGSKTPLMITNWKKEEPNGKTSENCLHAYGDNGYWNDIKCSYAMFAVCEVSI